MAGIAAQPAGANGRGLPPGPRAVAASARRSAPGEIALGAQTLRALHRQLGQTVQVVVDRVSTPGPATQHAMRIVGVAVLPSFSRGGFVSTDLGTGAVVPASVLSEPFARPIARRMKPVTTSSCSVTGPAPT